MLLFLFWFNDDLDDSRIVFYVRLGSLFYEILLTDVPIGGFLLGCDPYQDTIFHRRRQRDTPFSNFHRSRSRSRSSDAIKKK
jgi:hypothetical protein